MGSVQSVGKNEIIRSPKRTTVEAKNEPELYSSYHQKKSEVRQIIIGIARSLAVVKG